MVYLNRIYTKSGDTGETGLGDGVRVAKDDARIVAIGDLDELNALLGQLLAASSKWEEAGLVRGIQNDLFDVGADLCVPPAPDEESGAKLRITPAQVERLEREIDRLNERLQPLTSFVLPGGSVTAAGCHVARAACRRAERAVVTLMRTQRVGKEVLKYLNRLSDLLFVLSRVANADGRDDVLWVPGGGR